MAHVISTEVTPISYDFNTKYECNLKLVIEAHEVEEMMYLGNKHIHIHEIIAPKGMSESDMALYNLTKPRQFENYITKVVEKEVVKRTITNAIDELEI